MLHGTQEESHHTQKVTPHSLEACRPRKDQPQVHRYFGQVRSRSVPDARRQARVHGIPQEGPYPRGRKETGSGFGRRRRCCQLVSEDESKPADDLLDPGILYSFSLIFGLRNIIIICNNNLESAKDIVHIKPVFCQLISCLLTSRWYFKLVKVLECVFLWNVNLATEFTNRI
uniref:Uncharacterized protein n=1 Tax=Cacopsylla melanoneura TaxID=428564 RepID=A0A8D8TB85_9HEMI